MRAIYTRALKECTRHPVRAYTANPTTTYWDRSRGEVAVGPGCPVASAAEMKELIYLPESYNSLSTCIHTLSPSCSSPDDPLVPTPPSTVCRTRLFLFSPCPPPCSPPSCLRPYQPYLNFSPYPPPLAMRPEGYSPLLHFPRPFRMVVHAHNFRAPLPVTYVNAFTQPRVQSILSSSTSAGRRTLLVFLFLFT